MNNVIETLTNLLTSWGSRDIPLPDLLPSGATIKTL